MFTENATGAGDVDTAYDVGYDRERLEVAGGSGEQCGAKCGSLELRLLEHHRGP